MMGSHPELAIFRRFGAMNVQSMLYLQAELVHLELQLREYARDDEQSRDPERRAFSLNWQKLSESTTNSDDKQWKTMLRIRETLKEYSKLIPEAKPQHIDKSRPGSITAEHVSEARPTQPSRSRVSRELDEISS